MAAGQVRNQHWVPQCYLKGFAKSASKNAQLLVVDKRTRTSFTTSPRNVASARDFNRIEVDGVDPNLVEMTYANFESKVAQALRRMWQTRALGSDEDLNLLLNLIALMAVRTPRMRENVRDFHERIAKQIMHLTVANEERYNATMGRAIRDGHVPDAPKVTYEEMKQFVQSEAYTIEVSTTRHVGNEMRMMETVLTSLAQRRWLLVRAGADTGGFVTSDHPVGLQWSERKERNPFDSPGFGRRGTEVLFPVSHELLMVGHTGNSVEVIDAGPEQVAFANASLLWHAHRQVYARDDKFMYLRKDGAMRRGGNLLEDIDQFSG
ncbi:DUF4238 domain-containing protein [Massilia endophytica]|uniref:DUF4238 domain-containing protein n=1 Tax=Massilia endophytica TaxID=2899220 RepID=UPI001E368CE0|nr:DUF4238 domain-containing protein [Massilia endophytica]UGQ48580.1 DUF4238 domain-containing protein [Massilia endophytica]